MKPIQITLTPEQAQSVFEQYLANVREQQARPVLPTSVSRGEFFKMIERWPEGELRNYHDMERALGRSVQSSYRSVYLSQMVKEGKLVKVNRTYWKKVIPIDVAVSRIMNKIDEKGDVE